MSDKTFEEYAHEAEAALDSLWPIFTPAPKPGSWSRSVIIQIMASFAFNCVQDASWRDQQVAQGNPESTA
jgi:hypothetical protein